MTPEVILILLINLVIIGVLLHSLFFSETVRKTRELKKINRILIDITIYLGGKEIDINKLFKDIDNLKPKYYQEEYDLLLIYKRIIKRQIEIK